MLKYKLYKYPNRFTAKRLLAFAPSHKVLCKGRNYDKSAYKCTHCRDFDNNSADGPCNKCLNTTVLDEHTYPAFREATHIHLCRTCVWRTSFSKKRICQPKYGWDEIF